MISMASISFMDAVLNLQNEVVLVYFTAKLSMASLKNFAYADRVALTRVLTAKKTFG